MGQETTWEPKREVILACLCWRGMNRLKSDLGGKQLVTKKKKKKNEKLQELHLWMLREGVSEKRPIQQLDCCVEE